MKPLRIVLLASLAMSGLLVIAGFTFWYENHQPENGNTITVPANDARVAPSFLKMQGKARSVKAYIARKNFNNNICFLVDMDIASGSNRFFIYDLKNDSVLDAALVTHGRCNENWLEGRKYSNEPGSGCTSPGRYRIGNPYNGTFGLAYKLYGLDSSNSNAYARYVVLHSHECVPETEVDPRAICQSDGCPTVSQGFLKKLSAIIDKSPRPVLLWIYE